MGADISFIPLSRIPNSSTINSKTQPTIDLMNRILDFILKSADIRDMITLGNKSECKKWIMIGETKISSLFDKLKIQPEIGSDGILYIRKIDEITKNSNKQDSCKVIALFFVRLFQIIGALSLSIIDTKIPSKNYLDTEQKTNIPQKKGIPFFKKEEERKGLWYGGAPLISNFNYMKDYLIPVPAAPGTAAQENEFLLQTVPSKSSEISRQIPNIKINLLTDNTFQVVSTLQQNITFTLKSENQAFTLMDIIRETENIAYENTFTVHFKTSIQGKQAVDVEYENNDIDFVKFIEKLRDKISSLPKSQTIQILNNFKYLVNEPGTNNYILNGISYDKDKIKTLISRKPDVMSRFYYTFPITVDSKEVEIKVSFMLNIILNNTTYNLSIVELKNESDLKVINFVPDLKYSPDDNSNDNSTISTRGPTPGKMKFTTQSGNLEPTDRYKSTMPQYIYKQMNKIRTQVMTLIKTTIEKTKRGYFKPIDNSDSLDPKLKTGELWRMLIEDPPIKSFCTSRALELLNVSGLKDSIDDKKIIPLVYNTKFDLINNHSLPTPGKPITTAYGIKALSMLYDDVSNIYLRSTQKPIWSSDSYWGSSTNIKKDTKSESIGKIIASFQIPTDSSVGAVVGAVVDPVAAVDPETDLNSILEPSGNIIQPFDKKGNEEKVRKLRNQAILLFQKQFDHTNKVNALLKEIFIIDNNITLRPSILAEGILGIEKIAVKARDILTDYYSTCQTHFNDGVAILQNKSIKSSSTSNPSSLFSFFS
jgi:hypothetical protein